MSDDIRAKQRADQARQEQDARFRQQQDEIRKQQEAAAQQRRAAEQMLINAQNNPGTRLHHMQPPSGLLNTQSWNMHKF
jgi:hypothetical protein